MPITMVSECLGLSLCCCPRGIFEELRLLKLFPILSCERCQAPTTPIAGPVGAQHLVGANPVRETYPPCSSQLGPGSKTQAVLGLLGILPELLAPLAGTTGLSSKTSCSVKSITPAPCSGWVLAGLPVQLLGEGWCPVSLCLWTGDLGCNLPFSLSWCPSGIPGIQERTLVAVKPDGVQRRLVGDVIKRFERRGFKLVGMKLLQVPACHIPEDSLVLCSGVR